MRQNIIEHSFKCNTQKIGELYKNTGYVLWLTGLSGSGKSSIADYLQKDLIDNNHRAIVLDGDTLRSGLCKDLSFSQIDRLENLRRVGEVAKLLKNNGFITICSFISPLENQRRLVKEIVGSNF